MMNLWIRLPFIFGVFVFWVSPLAADPVDEELKEGYAIMVGDVVVSGPKLCFQACSAEEACFKHECTEIAGLDVCMDPAITAPYTACIGDDPCDEGFVCLQDAPPQKLQDFIDHKEDKGFNVYLFTPSDWGGGVGLDAALNMRALLQTKTPELNLKYLLLIGDPRTESDLPMHSMWPRNNTDEWWATNYKVPSDYFYGELDGNWDLDGDGKYGEFGNPNTGDPSISGDFAAGGSELLGVNRNYDLKVGRIPVYPESGVSDLDHILTKTINYQRSPFNNIAWRKAALLAAEGGNRFFFGELIRDQILIPNEFESYRVYDADCWDETDLDLNCLSPLTTLPDAMECSVNNVVDGWNTLQPGAVFWLSHGSSNSAIPILSSFVLNQLNDDYPVFTFQASCNNSTPEAQSNLSYALLVQGAIATIGATRESHGPGSPWPSLQGGSDNAGMGWEYANHLISLQENAGTAFFEIRKQNSFDKWWFYQNYVSFNLYGDPDVSLYDFAPVHSVNPVADQTLAEGESLIVSLSGQDDQGAPLQLEVNAMEEWMSFAPESGELELNPGFEHAGVYTVGIHSIGYGEKAAESLVIQITNVNRPPVILFETELTVTAGSVVEFPIVVEDEDGDNVAVSIAADTNLDWAEINAATLRLTPDLELRGDFSLTLIADDGEDMVEMALSISVEAPLEDVSSASEDVSSASDVPTADEDVGPADTDISALPTPVNSGGCSTSRRSTAPWPMFLSVVCLVLILIRRNRKISPLV